MIAKGERIVKGNKIAYDYTLKDGTRLKVTTEKKDRREEFTNYLSNRKPRRSELVKDTQLSARASDAEVSDAKIDIFEVKNKPTDDVRYLRNSKCVVYGWAVGGKIYLNRDAMNPDAPIHEYTHLWDEMLRKKNPALWLRGKELLKTHKPVAGSH